MACPLLEVHSKSCPWARLDQMGVIRVFLLDDVSHDGDLWSDFLNEVFHYTIRITDTTIT